MRYAHVTDPATASQWVAKLATQQRLGVDIETTPLPKYADDGKAGLDPRKSRIRLLQAATLSGDVAVFDLNTVPLEILQPLSNCGWDTFNGMFEYQHLSYNDFNVPPLRDLMFMDQMMVRKKHSKRGLGVVAGIPKEQQKSDWGGVLSPEQIKYAALDAFATISKTHEFEGQYPKAVHALWCAAIPQLGNAGLLGQRFDWDAHEILAARWAADIGKEKALLSLLVPGLNNPNSYPQINDWLYENVDEAILEDWPRTPGGALSAAADVLAKYQFIPELIPLYAYKKLQTLEGTYGHKYTKYKHPETSRLHGSYKIGYTITGRLSCNSPNTQQAPRNADFRRLFIADPGMVMISADYSQIELRVAAILSGDKAMMDAYARGVDLHKLTASRMAGVALDKVTADQRQAAKAVNFGMLFGQRPQGLVSYARTAYGVGMTLPQAKSAQTTFFRAYPDLTRWQRQQREMAAETGCVTTRKGLVRDFKAEPGNVRSMCVNAPIQGSAAEALLASIIRLPHTVYATVHDELTIMVPKEEAAQAAIDLQTAMTEGFLDIFPEAEALTRDLIDVRRGCSWEDVH